MTNDQKRRFIAELQHLVTNQLLKRVEDIPDDWGSIELRWLLAEHAESQMIWTGMEGRYDQYRRQSLIRGLGGSSLQLRYDAFWRGYTYALAFTAMIDSERGGDALFSCSGDFEVAHPNALKEFWPLLLPTEQMELQNSAVDFFLKTYELYDYEKDEHAGRDFHYTRNGHGCGFWDGDWEEKLGEKLTELSKEYSGLELSGTRGKDSKLKTAFLIPG